MLSSQHFSNHMLHTQIFTIIMSTVVLLIQDERIKISFTGCFQHYRLPRPCNIHVLLEQSFLHYEIKIVHCVVYLEDNSWLNLSVLRNLDPVTLWLSSQYFLIHELHFQYAFKSSIQILWNNGRNAHIHHVSSANAAYLNSSLFVIHKSLIKCRFSVKARLPSLSVLESALHVNVLN